MIFFTLLYFSQKLLASSFEISVFILDLFVQSFDRFAQQDVMHSGPAKEKLYLIRRAIKVSHGDGDDRRSHEEYDMQNHEPH